MRDALDSKRLMFSVVVALVPCIAWAVYNTGAQALAAEGVQYSLFEAIAAARSTLSRSSL